MTIARQSIAVALASGFLLLAGLSMARPSPAADFDGNGTGDVAVFRAFLEPGGSFLVILRDAAAFLLEESDVAGGFHVA